MASYIPFGMKLSELSSSQPDLNGPFEPLGTVEDRFGCGDCSGQERGNDLVVQTLSVLPH